MNNVHTNDGQPESLPEGKQKPFEPITNIGRDQECTHGQLQQLLLAGKNREYFGIPSIESKILPNDQMSFERTEELRQEGGYNYAVIYDTNPKGCFTKEQLTEKMRQFPRVLLFDHHGPSSQSRPVEKELTATEIILEELSKPQTVLAQVLRANAAGKVRILAVTNQGNFDPDGLISRFVLEHPTDALRNRAILTQVARYTDYEFFGGERYTNDFDPSRAQDHKKIGWEILEMINTQREQLVVSATGTSLSELDRSEQSRNLIRSVFVGDNKKYTPESVNQMFDTIGKEIAQILLEPHRYLTTTRPQRWQKYVERLKTVAQYSQDHLNVDDTGFLATFTPPDRPDNAYIIYDWLACGAGSSGLKAPEVPLLLSRDKNNQVVISVPYASQRKGKKNYNLIPVFQRLNQLENGNWGGREAVAFNFGPTKLTTEDLRRVILELRQQIES